MKKRFLGIVAIMLLLTMALPLTVNATTKLTTTATGNAKVGDEVEIVVTADNAVDSIQFDLKFDNDKYDYVIGSATTAPSDNDKTNILDATDSNKIADNIVRVSAFDLDLDGQKTDTVRLKFKAKKAGESTPFTLLKNTVEMGVNGEDKDIALQLTQIAGENPEEAKSEYVNENGEVIATLGPWGYIAPIRIYQNLGTSTNNIVAYALPYSEDVIRVSDIKQEFGSKIVIAGNDEDIVGTGKTFELNGVTYTILIYGDANGDGKVTTRDAFVTSKNDKTVELLNSELNKEASDVVKGNPKANESPEDANALAQQRFILRKQTGTAKKESAGKQYSLIIDKYVEEPGALVSGITAGTVTTEDYRYKDIEVTTVQSANKAEKDITPEMLTYELKLDGKPVTLDENNKKIAEVTYDDLDNDGIYTMHLYAAKTGKYEITPIIVGAGVDEGVQKKAQEAIAVQVNDSDEVNSIKLEGENSPISVAIGKQKTVSLTFEHKYTVNNGFANINDTIDLTEKIKNTTRVRLDENSVDANKFADTTKITGDNKLVIEPKVGSTDTTGATTLTVKVDNGTSQVYTQDIDVNIKKVVENEFTFNGVTNPTGNMDKVTLYDEYYPSNVANVQMGKPVSTDLIYTIIPIELKDDDGDPMNLFYSDFQTPGNVNNNAKIKILKNVNRDNVAVGGIYANPYYKDLTTGNYVMADSTTTEPIVAIGLALNVIKSGDRVSKRWNEQEITAGLTIQYTVNNTQKEAIITLETNDGTGTIQSQTPVQGSNGLQQTPAQGSNSQGNVSSSNQSGTEGANNGQQGGNDGSQATTGTEGSNGQQGGSDNQGGTDGEGSNGQQGGSDNQGETDGEDGNESGDPILPQPPISITPPSTGEQNPGGNE